MLHQVCRIVLGAFLALIVFAGSAAGECAWILWSAAFKPSILFKDILPSRGYKTRDECEHDLERREAREQACSREEPDTKYFFVCLPDTLDPRGPKAK